MYARDGFVLISRIWDRSGLITFRDTIQKEMSKMILKDNLKAF